MFMHGTPLLQQALQQVAACAVLHHNVDVLAVLEGAVEQRDEGDPAGRGRASLSAWQQVSVPGDLGDRLHKGWPRTA